MRSDTRLPPLRSLSVFECVGRLQSFRAASEELCITQSAVSYHIKSLEQSLGVKVFERHARGIAFVPRARVFRFDPPDIFPARGRHCRDSWSGAPVKLKVSVLPAFAANWLVRRLQRFNELHPDIEVLLDSALALADLDRGEADLSIRYGSGIGPERGQSSVGGATVSGRESRLSGTQRAHPEAGRCAEASVVTREPAAGMEHVGSGSRYLAPGCARASAHELQRRAAGRGGGNGIAMGRRLLIEDEIAAGALTQLLMSGCSRSRWILDLPSGASGHNVRRECLRSGYWKRQARRPEPWRISR